MGGGVETVGGDGSETGLVAKKKQSTTGIGASLIPDYRDKEEVNNNMACTRSTTKNVVARLYAKQLGKCAVYFILKIN